MHWSPLGAGQIEDLACRVTSFPRQPLEHRLQHDVCHYTYALKLSMSTAKEPPFPSPPFPPAQVSLPVNLS